MINTYNIVEVDSGVVYKITSFEMTPSGLEEAKHLFNDLVVECLKENKEDYEHPEEYVDEDSEYFDYGDYNVLLMASGDISAAYKNEIIK